MGMPKTTAGARALRRYLERHNLSARAFCEAHGICRQYVALALAGRATRASVDFALAVERATRGEITARMWGSETLRRHVEISPGGDADSAVENVTPSAVPEALA